MSAFRRRLMMMQGKRTLEYGVYIQAVDGTLHKPDTWGPSLEANGVAVVDERCSFVMAPFQNKAAWGGHGVSIPGIFHEGDSARYDYNGKANTDIIIDAVNDETCAAFLARDYLFPDGAHGYLPALGEMFVAYDHLSEIKGLLSIVGADENMLPEKSWTSTTNTTSNNHTVFFHGSVFQIGRNNTMEYLIFKHL